MQKKNLLGTLFYIYLFCKSTTQGRGGGKCQSEYEEQPPDVLLCNPYANGELRLECTASLLLEGPLTGRLSVEWFRSNLLPDDISKTEGGWTIHRLATSQENVTILQQRASSDFSMRVRSRLIVKQLSEHDIGQYWCRMLVDEEWMIPSDPLSLQHPNEYANLGPCSTKGAQSKMERKCAMWTFITSSGPATKSISEPVPLTSAYGVPPEISNGTEHVEDSDNMITTDELLEGSRNSMEFYAPTIVSVAFGCVIIALVLFLFYIKHRTKAHRKRNLQHQDRVSSAAIQGPLDYLVPVTLTRSQNQLQPQQDNTATVQQEAPMYWFQPVQRSTLLEHSYETMNHDYEDIFLESLNGGPPMMMKQNEAYKIPITPH